MLKPTYRPAQTAGPPPLPPSWTEHKAPTGHTYYYNSETKKSTYTRPSSEPNNTTAPATSRNPEPIHYDPNAPNIFLSPFPTHAAAYGAGPLPTHPQPFSGRGNFHASVPHGQSRRWQHPEDRPKSKHDIPGCHPWLLVRTRLGRRFVHNPSTNESFWKVPQDLIGGLVEFDIQERERREQTTIDDRAQTPTRLGIVQGEKVGESVEPEAAQALDEDGASYQQRQEQEQAKDGDDDGNKSASDEYEEVEITDDEMEEDQHTLKRQRLEEEEQETNHPIELGEDDMAYQLAQMGASYDLDPGEYGGEDYEGDWEEGAEGLPLSAEEASASFKDILDDYHINPFTTWENILTDNRVVEDDRYTLLSNMKARKEAFAEWSAAKIQALKQLKDQQVKRNPRIPYFAFLEKHATPKLYWPEFKRKHKREPELKDAGLSEKEREKLYREYIIRITKTPEATLQEDLKALLQSIPPSQLWNRSTSLDGVLPPALLTDVRFISLKGATRNQICEEFIAKLPSSEEAPANEMSQEDSQRAMEREQREAALERRTRQVEEAKKQHAKQLLYGQRRLRDGEMELDRATRVGKGGLREVLNGIENVSQSEE